MFNRRYFMTAAMLACAGCSAKSESKPPEPKPNLGAAKAKYQTTVHYASSDPVAVAKPPKGVFDIVTYPSPVGNLPAYLTPDPGDGRKHPAIVWMTGGESNTIGDVWTPQPRDNDQSAAAYRKAGIVMMYPSLRGGNRNPGQIEAMYGEVDDVLAAADYLAAQPWVDPARLYLGGHSTGGTLAMLTAETRGSRFRAVIASGAVEDVAGYGSWFSPYDFRTLPREERTLRAPGQWLTAVEGRLFVVEGDGGNIESLRVMQQASTNPAITFVEVPGASHFSVLEPLNEVIARKVAGDDGQGPLFDLSASEILAQMAQG
ncbi:MAG: prolyl oligopeptidase family serine peptidase [Asticcacaulis sp.]|nr:prolyl oligopeptidase family serine peptidase [Asticcacaulis sp.]